MIRTLLYNSINRIAALAMGKTSRPREIVIEVTNNCNLNCIYCFNKLYINDKDQENNLDTKSLIKIIDNISHSSIPLIRFSGGEPLLRKDLFDLMGYAKSRGLRIWLNTNATLLNKEKVNLLSNYVENVLISLNAFDFLSEYRVTNRNLFKKKLMGIKLLKNSSIKIVRCGTIATKYNIQHLEKIHGLIRRLKVDRWELFRPIPTRTDLFPVDNNDIASLIEKLLRLNKTFNKTYKIFNALPFCSYNPEKVAKVAQGAESDDGHTRFVIDNKGMSKPMYYLVENIGDPFKESILNLWNNKLMKELRYLKLVPEICKKCKYLKICKGGSRIVSKLTAGSYTQLDYLARPERYSKVLFKN